MDFIGGIAAATEGLKLVNELRKIDKEVDKAELKLRLVDVADKLLDSKQALQDAQEREFDLRKRIAILQDQLAERPRLKDISGLLFEVGQDGKLLGAPYCNHCYVSEDKLFRLLPEKYNHRPAHKCQHCKAFLTNASDRGVAAKITALGGEID